MGEVFPLETEGYHPPSFADLHWLSFSDSLRKAKDNAQMVVVVITCVGIIITMHPSTVPFAPPPQTAAQTRSFKGGFYSAEQFKRKWLLFPGLVCTSVRSWLFRRKWGPWYAGFFFFNIVLFQPACVGDACVFFFAVLLLFFFYSQMLMFRKHLIGFLVRFSQEKI